MKDRIKEARLPWNERVTMLQVNPEAATLSDIVRLAEELSDLKRGVGESIKMLESDKGRLRVLTKLKEQNEGEK